MVTKNEALRIKHISQYCEEIGKDCDNCLFQDCFSKNEIRTAIKKGEIPAIRLGSQWRIPKEELEKLIGNSTSKNKKEES